MLEEAKKYFAIYGEPIDQVWYEEKQDTYYCRTKSAEFWQINTPDLRMEIKKLKADNRWSQPD